MCFRMAAPSSFRAAFFARDTGTFRATRRCSSPAGSIDWRSTCGPRPTGSERVIVFGSFVSDKEAPHDIDLFLVMEDSFDLSLVTGEAKLLFEHAVAQSHFGASIFWSRRASCFPSEEEMVAGWGLKRDGTVRGLVEVERGS